MSVPLTPARAAGAVAMLLGGLCCVLAAWAAPAHAVQTTTFSLTPTGERTSIIVYADTGTRTDHFVLHDLRSRPITVELQVLSLAKSGSTFKVGRPGVGFSSEVSLTASTVRLAGGQTKVLPVRVNTGYDGRDEQFAVIDAHQVTPASSNGSQPPHLQLAVELKPAPARPASGTSSPSTGADVLYGVAGALIAFAVIAQLAAWQSRRIRVG